MSKFMRFFRSHRRLTLAASVLAPILISLAAIPVADTLQAESYVRSGECTMSTCGQLMVADCGASHDGPLLVYTRFPRLHATREVRAPVTGNVRRRHNG